MIKKTKLPQPVEVFSPSAIVPHDEHVNDALASAGVDKGLQPNGVTIDAMRENPEFYQKCDDLDRPAIAAQTSGKLAADVKKVVHAMKSAQTDRNQPKNRF